MSQPATTMGFGAYLREAIEHAGFATPTHFARSVGMDPSVILRWLSEEQRPTIRSIERIAPPLGRTLQEVVLAAYPDRLSPQTPPTATRLHPLAVELGQILSPTSPIGEKDRQALITVITRLLDPYRRLMRRRRSA